MPWATLRYEFSQTELNIMYHTWIWNDSNDTVSNNVKQSYVWSLSFQIKWSRMWRFEETPACGLAGVLILVIPSFEVVSSSISLSGGVYIVLYIPWPWEGQMKWQYISRRNSFCYNNETCSSHKQESPAHDGMPQPKTYILIALTLVTKQ